MAITQGMRFSRNHGQFQHYDFARPLTVAADEYLHIIINGVANQDVTQAEWLHRDCSLIPQLVANVGDRATVIIALSNSANVTVEQVLTLGTSSRSEDEDDAASLIATLIHGTIGRRAVVRIEMDNCANVVLSRRASCLLIAGASLIDSLVNIPQPASPLDGVNVHVSINQCATVKGLDAIAPSGNLTIDKGQLVNEVVDCLEVVNSCIHILEQGVANVSARAVHITDGELVDETLDAGNVEGSVLHITMLGVANVCADSVVILEGELVDEVLDVESIRSSQVTLELDGVACVLANKLVIESGELIDELIDASAGVYASDIRISMLNSACYTGGTARISHGELLDELIDTSTLSRTCVAINLDASANVNCNRLTLREGELVDEIIDCETLDAGRSVTINIANSACINTVNLKMHDSQLMDELIDCGHLTPGVMNVQVTGSSNIHASGVTSISNSSLGINMLDVDCIQTARGE